MPWNAETARKAAEKSAETRRRKAEERARARWRQQHVQRQLREGMTIIDAMALWPEFKAKSWDAWRVFLKALFGLPLSEPELETFVRHTGRQTPKPGGYTEVWNVVGRRGGKSRIAALVAVFLALFRDYSSVLAPGEQGVIQVLAADRRQARTVHGYVRGFVAAAPTLQELVADDLKERIVFKNGVGIEIMTASYKSVRGFTVLGCVADECSFWKSDDKSSNPDKEVFDAIRPAMATVNGAILLSISTPYARRGELWRAYNEHYGQDSDVLVWASDSRGMNPSLPQSVVDRAYERDSSAAAAEYGGEFRKDVEAFLTPEAVAAVTIAGRYELAYEQGHRYAAFVDPSGGSMDSYTLAIAHNANGIAVLDCIREVAPPFSPEQVTERFAETIKSYGLHETTGDRYGGAWPADQFAKHQIQYRPSKMSKSDIYAALLPLINSGHCELLDNRTLRLQLEGLDRRVARSGKDSIDHAPGGHDDVANAAAGAIVAVGAPRQTVKVGVFYV